MSCFTYAYVPQTTKGRGKKKEDAESDEHAEESAEEEDHEDNPEVGLCVRVVCSRINQHASPRVVFVCCL